MARDLYKQRSQGLVTLKGLDVGRIFSTDVIANDKVKVPASFHCLPDFRPFSEKAYEEALEGRPPVHAGMPRFDPLLGPFSVTESALSPWAQSLEFLRDIKTASIDGEMLSHNWTKTWLENVQGQALGKQDSLFAPVQHLGAKSDRLIVRSRRILNCLSHILPILSDFDPDWAAPFWEHLLYDIGKIGAHQDTIWDHLKDRFDPPSLRAIWLRNIAILGVEASLPGYLQRHLVHKSLEQLKASIQSDGMINGGSIIATLAAGADLCSLTRIAPIEPILEQVRHALSCLRHSDGTLITFGGASGDHALLLKAVMGPDNWKPANQLLSSGIGRMSAKKTIVWMRAPQSSRAWGPTCEIDVNGSVLLTNFNATPSAVLLASSPQVTDARCKRRDEPDFFVLEASATVTISGKTYSTVRQIRISSDGSRIFGEDLIRSDNGVKEVSIEEICFAVGDKSRCFLSKDKLSVLIVTSQQQAWRFRVQGMDFALEIRSEQSTDDNIQTVRSAIYCKCSNLNGNTDFKATWQITLEEAA